MSQTAGKLQVYDLVPSNASNASNSGKSSYRDATLAEIFASLGRQVKNLASDFSVTSNTTLSLITGFTGSLVAGKKYKFKAILFTESDISAGVKVSLEGTSVFSSLKAEALSYEAGIVAQTRVTAFSTNAVAITSVTNNYIVIEGAITCTTSGTFEIHFAQNVSNAVPSKVLSGSIFDIEQIS